MAFTYTIINGQRVETSVARAFAALAAELRRVWNLDLLVSSGTRTRAEQQALYNAYLRGGTLAAPPGQSNHEEFGPTGPRALDVRDSGGDPGVTRFGTARANWLRANAPRFGFNPAGYGFRQVEPWHIEYTGSLGGGSNGTNPDGTLVVDGRWGAATTTKLQAVLGVNQDGQLGPVTIKALQARLGVDQDGQIGPNTTRALQARVGAAQDGELGPETIKALQRHLNGGGTLNAPAPASSDKLVEDGLLGPATISKLQHVVGAVVDGAWGTGTTKALQQKLGVPDDGQLGPQTIKALQINVGTTADGDMGPATIKALQVFLNAGKSFTKVDVVPEVPVPAATPRPAVYPKAVRGWLVPLSSNRDAGAKVTKLIIHHTTNPGDEEPYFKTKNSRSSCPTWYQKANGDVIEMIAPDKRPSATGSANNGSVAIETQNTTTAPNWETSAEALESIAQIAAWLSKQTEIGGVPFSIKLDRQHIIGHNEAGVNATACPGPFISSRLDAIVARAKEIAEAQLPSVPSPQPDTVAVDRLWLTSVFDKLKTLLGK